MNEPPIDLDDLTADITKSVKAMWESSDLWENLGNSVQGWIQKHIDIEHSIPGASSVEMCILRLWYDAKGVEKTNEPPTSWMGAQMTGILSELVYVSILENAGIELLENRTLQFQGGLMLGTPDAITKDFTIEIKSRTGYQYKRFIGRYGYVSGVEPNVYTQVQVAIDSAGVEWALLLILPSDFSQLQKTMRLNKRWGPDYNLPPFHLEWVERNDDHIAYITTRAKTIKEAIDSDDPPQREYTGIPVDIKGKLNWPCGFCVYNTRCISDNGYGDR